MNASSFAITAFLMLAATVQARLGESLTEVRHRYGMEIDSASATNRPPYSDYSATFEKDNFRMQISFIDEVPSGTKAIEVLYTKIDGRDWTHDEMVYLLDANDEGHKWSAPEDTIGIAVWTRDDGAKASFDKIRKRLSFARPERFRHLDQPPAGMGGL